MIDLFLAYDIKDNLMEENDHLSSESDSKSRLRPCGELKVAYIPFSDKEHYAHTLSPGNSVWGKSWRHQSLRSHLDISPLGITQPSQEEKKNDQEKPNESPLPLVDKFTKSISHVIIGLGMLVFLMWLSKNNYN